MQGAGYAPALLLGVLEAGATGYLLKDAERAEFFDELGVSDRAAAVAVGCDRGILGAAPHRR